MVHIPPMHHRDGALGSLRVLLIFLVASLLACGPQNGARPLELVRKDTAAIRSRTLLDLEHSLIFPRCEAKPSAAYACALLATRGAEQDILVACGEAVCVRQKLEALYGAVRERAESLGIDVRAVALRCGPPCRDMRALELEVLRLSADGAEQRARQSYLRADSAEREALEREREDVPPFVEKKKERDANLDALLATHHQELLAAGRDGATLPHATLCATTQDCAPDTECMLFREAVVGTCEKD